MWKKLQTPNEDEIRALRREYRGKTQFLVDESAGEGLAKLLQGLGYSAKYVGEIGLRGRSDEDVFAAAWKEKRVVITHDPDFLDDKRFPPHRNPGIVVIRPGSDGRDNRGLLACLVIATTVAGNSSRWFRQKKLDFASSEEFSIRSPGRRTRFWWPTKGDAMIWEE